jgi:multidrug efflux pump subunit AcrA (membrane-fusion protein)
MDSQLAYLELPMGHRGELNQQQATEVILSTSYAGQHYQWLGTVVRTESEIDSKSRMTTVVARVDNIQQADQPPLQIGLFVSAVIKGKNIDNIFRLPRAALRNQNQVLIVDDNNRLRFRGVDVLRFERDNIIISSGLSDGDRVNISPLQSVTDGMRVTPSITSQTGRG